jgi:transposase-like protein
MAKNKGLNVSQVQAALLQCGGNVTLAAHRLNVREQTVRYYRQQYPQCKPPTRPTMHPVQQTILNVLYENRCAVYFYGIQTRADSYIPTSTLWYHLQKLEHAGQIIREGKRGGFRLRD